MAYFKKYNGYYVKDAEALKHVSINGNTVTTKDADGNTVDQFKLPGGFPSGTYMSYLSPNVLEPYMKAASRRFFVSSWMNYGNNVFGDLIGSADITYTSGDNAKFTLNSISVETLRAWRTYSKDSNGALNSELAYYNNYLRQIRPSSYRAEIAFCSNDSVPINANLAKTFLSLSSDALRVNTAAGRLLGYGRIVGARIVPYMTGNAEKVMCIIDGPNIIGMNLSTNTVYVRGFVLDVEVIIQDDLEEHFLANPTLSVPFIESANVSAATSSQVTTTVVVKTAPEASSTYYLDEYVLQLDNSTKKYAWTVNSSQEILVESVKPNNHTFTFNYTPGSYFEAVAYKIRNLNSESDALPIPAYDDF